MAAAVGIGFPVLVLSIHDNIAVTRPILAKAVAVALAVLGSIPLTFLVLALPAEVWDGRIRPLLVLLFAAPAGVVVYKLAGPGPGIESLLELEPGAPENEPAFHTPNCV